MDDNEAPDIEIISTIKGFTLVPDVLVSTYGLVCANVWGIVRRYCKMKRGVCDASLEELAKHIGVTKRTVMNHLEILCRDGYIEDTTPNLRNWPHTYKDTGKLTIESQTKVEFSGKKMRSYKKEPSKSFSVNEEKLELEQSPSELWNG